MMLELDLVTLFAIFAAGSLLLAQFAEATCLTGAVPERDELDDAHKWDLSDLYADVAAWEVEFAAMAEQIKNLAAMKGTLGQSGEALLAVLTTRDEMSVALERLYAFAMLLKDQDTRESEAQALSDRIGTLAVEYGQATSWIEPELIACGQDKVSAWCDDSEALAVFRHAFDDLFRQQQHVLSPREEELLAMGGKALSAASQAFGMLTNADMKFPNIKDADGNEVELSLARYSLFLESPDRDLRRRAFEALSGTYLSYKNTFAATLGGAVQRDVFHARARNYPSALESALHPDNVPVAVYDNLIGTIRTHLPKLHRYMDIRKKKLGLKAVHLYDMYVPLTGSEAPKIEYGDAVATVIDGLKPLGDEYLEPLKKGFGSGWIDVYEAKGKRSGAYSMGTYACHPYVLMNYNGTFNHMFTLAHEMGHALHTWFTQHNQPIPYGDYPIFLAEVASTTNEILLGDYLRERADDNTQKLFLVNQAVENIRGTVITQTMFAEFEKTVHAQAEAGEPLTFETISEIYTDLVKAYYGPAYEHDEQVSGNWVRIPHFYRGFYVYKYATSFCAASALANRILAGTPGALEGYLGFLKSGCSDYPIDILRRAGVDMSTPDPIAATMERFDNLLDELETLI